MKTGEKLRSLRLKRRWRLKDLADALGVTTATISRVERGLQEPSPALLEVWQQLLSGERWRPVRLRRPRRRPRGALSSLAELFLADVKAGLDGSRAGWRDPVEIGLTTVEAESLGSDVERDGQGRVRAARNIFLESMVQAQNILNYRSTLEAEEQVLVPIIEEYLPPLWRALDREGSKGAVLVSGLAEMIRTAAPVLDAYRSLIGDDLGCLIPGATGPAHLILESVGIIAPSPVSAVLEATGLSDLTEPREEGEDVLKARTLVQQLGIPTGAGRLGRTGVIAVGAAWGVVRCLESRKVAILTEVGQRRVAETFWQGIRLSREEVDAAWRRLVEVDGQTDKERIGSLLWSWPEVF